VVDADLLAVPNALGPARREAEERPCPPQPRIAGVAVLPGDSTQEVADLMLVGMRKQPDTWTPLGTLTAAIAAKLTRGQAELEKCGGPAFPPQGTMRANAGTAAEYPRRTSRHRQPPLGRGVEEVGAAPSAGRMKGGPVRRGQGGANTATKANVIDYRERPVLLAAWGAHQFAPYGALPNHPKRPRTSARRGRNPRTPASAT